MRFSFVIRHVFLLLCCFDIFANIFCVMCLNIQFSSKAVIQRSNAGFLSNFGSSRIHVTTTLVAAN